MEQIMTDTELLNFAEHLLDIGCDFYQLRDGVYANTPNDKRVKAGTFRTLLRTLKTQEEESESRQLS